MGGGCTKQQRRVSTKIAKENQKSVQHKNIDQRILMVLQKKKKDSEQGNQVHSFDQVIMQFSTIRKAFMAIRKTFDDFDKDGNQKIDLAELKEAMERLNANVEDDDIIGIFQQSGEQDNGSEVEALSFKEFIACLAAAYLLDLVPSFNESIWRASQVHTQKLTVEEKIELAKKQADNMVKATTPERASLRKSGRRGSAMFGHTIDLAKAFHLVIEAWLFFDKDASGSIDKDEMRDALNPDTTGSFAPVGRKRTGPSTRGGAGIAFLTEDRFNEIDWDHNGEISFKEFLLAFSSWVGLDEEDEDDV